jgi:hypothetical protein
MGLFFYPFPCSAIDDKTQDLQPPQTPIHDGPRHGSAPRLRLPFIPFPGLVPQLLLSATGLFLLHLRGIPHSAGYITVRLLASPR